MPAKKICTAFLALILFFPTRTIAVEDCSKSLRPNSFQILQLGREILSKFQSKARERREIIQQLDTLLLEVQSKLPEKDQEREVIEGEILDLYAEFFPRVQLYLDPVVEELLLQQINFPQLKKLLDTHEQLTRFSTDPAHHNADSPSAGALQGLEIFLVKLGISRRWTEIDLDRPSTPEAEAWYFRFYESRNERLRSEVAASEPGASGYFRSAMTIEDVISEMDLQAENIMSGGLYDFFSTERIWNLDSFTESVNEFWESLLGVRRPDLPLLKVGADNPAARSEYFLLAGGEHLQIYLRREIPNFLNHLQTHYSNGQDLHVLIDFINDHPERILSHFAWIWGLKSNDHVHRRLLADQQDILMPVLRYILGMKHFLARASLVWNGMDQNLELEISPDLMRKILEDNRRMPGGLLATLTSIVPGQAPFSDVLRGLRGPRP